MSFPSEIETALASYYQAKGFIKKKLSLYSSAIVSLKRLSADDQNNIFKIYQCFMGSVPKQSSLSYSVYQAVLNELNRLHPKVKIDLLHLLESAGLLNLNNFNRIKSYKSPGSLFDPLQELHNVGLLQQDNFNFIYRHRDLPWLNKVLHQLRKAALLTQNNFNAAMTCLNLRSLSNGLRCLKYNQLLTQENFNVLIEHDKPEVVTFILGSLNLADGLLTQRNFDRLFLSSEYYFLCTEEASKLVWRSVPPQLLTLAVLEELIRCSKKQNPATEVKAYVNQLLGNYAYFTHPKISRGLALFDPPCRHNHRKNTIDNSRDRVYKF